MDSGAHRDDFEASAGVPSGGGEASSSTDASVISRAQLAAGEISLSDKLADEDRHMRWRREDSNRTRIEIAGEFLLAIALAAAIFLVLSD